ncbi:MAG: glycosyltransferase family 4 protein [Gammaproteobacteria bacterium]|nr:glycosyltransferase family 4 protein [Gammaproteobacteria bacterium]MCP5137025.1 glycosyltransferase family 4 protein [Gammaproteobacteria bacterium]
MLGALIFALVVAFALGLGLAEWVRRNARRLRMIDEPNARSSHSQATPRGGGLGIYIGFLILGLMAAFGGLPLPVPDHFIVWLLAFTLLAAVGFADDRGHIPPPARLAVHAGAAVLALYALGWPSLMMPLLGTLPHAIATMLLAVALIWLINLFNFMDGIDGIAGIEVVTVLLGLVLVVLAIDGNVTAAMVWPLILIAGCAGFLVWNWSPAKVFMGDAASGFLGLALGVMLLDATNRFGVDPIAALILPGVFMVDASWTLLRRVIRRQRVHQAHRSHAYQRGSRLWGARLQRAGVTPDRARARAHRGVSMTVAAINLFWLLPWSAVAAHFPDFAWSALVVAYLPLIAAAVSLGAGVIDD